MSSPTGSPENIDYERTMNVSRVHAAVAREHETLAINDTPLTLRMFLSGTAVALLAGGLLFSNYGLEANKEGWNYQAPLPPGVSSAAADTRTPEQKWLDEGKAAYATTCQGCHGDSGAGNTGSGYPPLAGSEYVTKGEEMLATIVLKGLQGPITVKGTSYGTAVMNARGGLPLTDKQIAQILSYIRNAWGNKGSYIMTDQIQALNEKIAGLPTPLPSSELSKIDPDANLPPSKKPLGGGAAPAPAPATN